jgi:hypothetical protein
MYFHVMATFRGPSSKKRPRFSLERERGKPVKPEEENLPSAAKRAKAKAKPRAKVIVEIMGRLERTLRVES